MNVYLRYLLYAMLFALYLFVSSDWLGPLQRQWLANESNVFLIFLYRYLPELLFGFLVGGETLRQTLGKKGKWALNVPKVVGFCLPLLLFALLDTLAGSGYLPDRLIPSFLLDGPAANYAMMLLGYGLITSLHKK